MSKFVINRGMENEFIITIKQTGTTLPMEISGTDMFECRLLNKSDGTVVTELPVSIENAQNGKIKIVVSEMIANGLKWEFGEKPDGYYPKAGYKLFIDCNTVNNGKFVAKINKVYVE